MANAFDRTLRSVAADDGRGMRWTLAVILVLFAAWGAWCLAATVVDYEVTTDARIAADGGRLHVVAQLAPSAMGRVRPGQPAYLRLDAFPWPRHPGVRATVEQVAADLTGGTVRVEIALIADRDSPPLRPGLTGRVEIEVDELTPATLFLRTLADHWGRPADGEASPR